MYPFRVFSPATSIQNGANLESFPWDWCSTLGPHADEGQKHRQPQARCGQVQLVRHKDKLAQGRFYRTSGRQQIVLLAPVTPYVVVMMIRLRGD